VDLRGRGELVHLSPVGAHEAAQAAHLLAFAPLLRIFPDARPGTHRIRMFALRLAPEVEQARDRSLDASRRAP